MDVTIHEALLTSKAMLDCLAKHQALPSFSIDPMA
jgi:hypothetical protein